MSRARRNCNLSTGMNERDYNWTSKFVPSIEIASIRAQIIYKVRWKSLGRIYTRVERSSRGV